MLTGAIRGDFAARMRALSESHSMSLAKLLNHALLVYEADIEAGYGARRLAGEPSRPVAAEGCPELAGEVIWDTLQRSPAEP